MLHKILRQQNLLNYAFFKILFVCSGLTFILSLTTYTALMHDKHLPETLILAVFPRYSFFFGLFPLLLLTLLSTLKFRLQDILQWQSRTVLVWQTIYRISLVILTMVAPWILGNLMAIFFSRFNDLLAETWFTIIVRSIYLWLACFLLAVIIALVFFVALVQSCG